MMVLQYKNSATLTIHCEKIIDENTAKSFKNTELEIYLVLTHPQVKNYEIWIHKQTYKHKLSKNRIGFSVGSKKVNKNYSK